jgi:hypothetical protein
MSRCAPVWLFHPDAVRTVFNLGEQRVNAVGAQRFKQFGKLLASLVPAFPLEPTFRVFAYLPDRLGLVQALHGVSGYLGYEWDLEGVTEESIALNLPKGMDGRFPDGNELFPMSFIGEQLKAYQPGNIKNWFAKAGLPIN